MLICLNHRFILANKTGPKSLQLNALDILRIPKNWMGCSILYSKSTFQSCSPGLLLLEKCYFSSSGPKVLCPSCETRRLGVCTFAFYLDSDYSIHFSLFLYFFQTDVLQYCFFFPSSSVFCHLLPLFITVYMPFSSFFQCSSISCTFFLGTQRLSRVHEQP